MPCNSGYNLNYPLFCLFCRLDYLWQGQSAEFQSAEFKVCPETNEGTA